MTTIAEKESIEIVESPSKSPRQNKISQNPPKLDDQFLQIKSKVDGVKDISYIANSVHEAAQLYNEIGQQLNKINFDEIQKQWVSHIAVNFKLLKDMADEVT